MNWDALAAIGEMLGALGVIASLVYLAMQVRASTSHSRRAAAQSVQTKIHTLLEALATNPALADTYVRSSKGLAALSTSEAMQVSATYLALIRAYEELLHYHQSGVVDEWAWTSVRAMVRSTVSTAGFADWWAARGGWFSGDFQAHVAAELMTGETRDLGEELLRRAASP